VDALDATGRYVLLGLIDCHVHRPAGSRLAYVVQNGRVVPGEQAAPG
jgi:imidazolonepropionase-like amidohydrolase